MGLFRKGMKISTLGLAPIHYRDKAEREIRVSQQQLGVQRQMLDEQRAANAAKGAMPGDALEQLERPGRLRDQGVLTDAEFEAQKAQLLKRDAHTRPRDWRR